MSPEQVVRLLKRILPWIPSVNQSIRAEIEEIIDQLQRRRG